MTATSDIVVTGLTLEIGDNPSPERFMKAAHAFFGYVAELSAQVASGHEIPRWFVRVRQGSNMVAVEPATDVPTDEHRFVYSRAESGIQDLLVGGLEASTLPEGALTHLGALSELASGPSERPTFIRLWVERRPVVMDGAIAGMIREEGRLGYSDFGTVEGLIDTVQDRRGKLQFRVRDQALGQTVMCHLTEDQLEVAFAVFRKRVEVSGVIKYRKNGQPINIRVERIERLPDDNELPTAEDVKGLLRTA